MSISERLSAFLANPSQVLTRESDICYLFCNIDYGEADQYPDGMPEDDERYLDRIVMDGAPTERASKADDISAFVILDRIHSDNCAAVAHAEHDQVWLKWDICDLKGKATVQDILNLRALGVNTEGESLIMYV